MRSTWPPPTRRVIPHGHAPPFDPEGILRCFRSRLVMSTPADLEFTDLSDLTELSSGDETASSITKGSKGKQPAKDSFVLKNTLRPPRSVSYTTKWLHGAADRWSSRASLNLVSPTDQLTLQHIDLDPEYQVAYPQTSRLFPYNYSSAGRRLARDETNGPNRFRLPQLLHSSNHFL
jgi:hypothetical protein